MKKYNIILFALFGLFAFFSCEDDIGTTINPAAEDGTLTFELNRTRYSDWVYVLEEANEGKDMEALTCVQPDYGFTAAVTYKVEVSLNDQFTEGNYAVLPSAINGEKVSVNTKEMNNAITTLWGDNVPDPVEATDVYMRLRATISDATTTVTSTTPIVKDVYSNSIVLKILPYVDPLKFYYEVTPRPYFIIGLADGNWSNEAAAIGKSIYPLSLVGDKKYDRNGDGEFTYTGYFQADKGFKLIRDLGSWDEQWGSTDGGLTPSHNDGGSQNLTVPADGYYTITLNSINNTLSIEPSNLTPTVYATIGLIGDINGWADDIVMGASEAVNNHVWYTTYTFDGDAPADGGVKFRADADWSVNWGGDNQFPYGLTDSKNILYTAGTYIIVLNDLDGCYYFFKQ